MREGVAYAISRLGGRILEELFRERAGVFNRSRSRSDLADGPGGHRSGIAPDYAHLPARESSRRKISIDDTSVDRLSTRPAYNPLGPESGVRGALYLIRYPAPAA